MESIIFAQNSSNTNKSEMRIDITLTGVHGSYYKQTQSTEQPNPSATVER